MIYDFVNPNRGFYTIFVPLIKVLLPWRDWDCLPFEKNFRFFFLEMELQFLSPKKLNTLSPII